MINPDSLKNLNPNKSHWSTGETTVVRVPKYLKENVLSFARDVDSGEIELNNSTVTIDKLKAILAKIDSKESGYRSNSASQLIKDLKEFYSS